MLRSAIIAVAAVVAVGPAGGKVPNQYQRGRAGDAGRTPNMSWTLGLALTMWNPFVGLNADALGWFSALAREWEDL